MKTQREYNGVCKVPSQVLPSAADLKRLQKKRKKMEDQLKAKGDSEETGKFEIIASCCLHRQFVAQQYLSNILQPSIDTGISGTKHKDNRAAEGDVKKSPTSTKSASKNDSKSLVHETSRRFLLQRRGQASSLKS
ncbi:hypothetical protein B9Z55_010008 [Caenorhabditis nigoni]|uniref:Uncharacterized protein n=1 Tax=Caenorhabditis nigoni TaxID=1611254 RepID=A0A2G5UE30_9PELO|nr:hypothetical protein B9Z55_010008 [Caenorhabditis nigoni]